jgi:hypothetical protein
LYDADLHKERLQNFAMGGSGMTEPSEDALEHRMLEEELQLQLDLLKDHTPDPSLFPDDKEELEALPHLKDQAHVHMKNTGEVVEDADDPIYHLTHPTPEEVLVLEETVLEESNLEPLMVCLAIGALMLLPQLLQH